MIFVGEKTAWESDYHIHPIAVASRRGESAAQEKIIGKLKVASVYHQSMDGGARLRTN